MFQQQLRVAFQLEGVEGACGLLYHVHVKKASYNYIH